MHTSCVDVISLWVVVTATRRKQKRWQLIEDVAREWVAVVKADEGKISRATTTRESWLTELWLKDISSTRHTVITFTYLLGTGQTRRDDDVPDGRRDVETCFCLITFFSAEIDKNAMISIKQLQIHSFLVYYSLLQSSESHIKSFSFTPLSHNLRHLATTLAYHSSYASPCCVCTYVFHRHVV